VSETSDAGDPQPAPGHEGTPPPPSGPGKRSLLPFILGGAVLLLILGGIVIALVAGAGDDGNGTGESASSRTTTSSDRQAEKARNEDTPDDIDVPDADPPRDLGDEARFDRLADECFDGDPSSCDDLYNESDLGSDYEEYGATCGGRTEDGQGGGCAELYPDPDFADLRRGCADGDNGACDDLFEDSSPGSVDEAFGSTCGHRSDDELEGSCEAENP
jgi:hypothetical protein